MFCLKCVISRRGGGGKNVRKCEKGGGGEHPPKSVISYLNSPLVCVKVDLPIIDLL